MQMNGNLTNTELSASPKFHMKNPVVFEALVIPVEVNVCAHDGDVVDTDFENFWTKLEVNQTSYIYKWSNISLQEKRDVPEVRPAENYQMQTRTGR